MMHIAAFVALVALIGVPLFSSSSASSSQAKLTSPSQKADGTSFPGLVRPQSKTARIALEELLGNSAPLGFFPLLTPQAPPGPESIATFESDCATASQSFATGDTVCAKASNLPNRERRIYWVNPDEHVVQIDTVTANSPSGSRTVNQVGRWRAYLVDPSDGSARAVASFSVSDAQNPAVDLSVGKASGDGTFTAGGFARYTIAVTNNGPDTASSVTLSETTPNYTTFVGVTPADAGAAAFTCTPGSPTVCTAASLAAGTSATFTFVYTVDAGAAVGTVIENTASVTSSTTELNSADNSTTIAGTVTGSGGGNPTACSVACPDDITTVANTTDQNNNPGANVHFSPPSGNDECGVIVVDHCNDCFFPVGTTTVTATATTGQSCSFTVTVTPANSGGTTISCPSNKTADADSNCQANVQVGTASATGNNVTVIGTRSDGKPMYDCDANGNCTRRSSDDPFAAGTTTITWIAYSHDVAGPYTTPGNAAGDTFEEQHRTGSASCTQTVTVNDVTPPTITATNSAASADANCQAPVPDYSNSATDNCACAGSDTSQECQDRNKIVVTQDPAAGTLVGLGPHTIHLTATDEANNTSTKDVTFTVNDTTAPTINCPANITASNDAGQCSATVNPGTATATDNCDSSPTISGTRSDNQPLNAPYPKGTTTITWTAIDDSGNLSSCYQTVTVNDTENPTISCPANITKGNDPGVCGAVVTYTTPVGSDNCPGATTAQTAGLPSGSTFPVGTTTNTFEVTDTSGNKTSCSFTVTVNDVENPVISCPASQTLEPTCPSGAVATWTPPVGTDNCPGAVTTRTGPAPGSVFPIGTTTVTYTVNDAHGHSASCNFTVTVKTVTQTIDGLKTSVNNSSLSPSNKGGLVSKLQAAEDALAAGHTNTACQKLADFINSTQNMISHGDISAAVGNAWISTAAHVRNTIGCTNNPCS